jgi:hypothetical protein
MNKKDYSKSDLSIFISYIVPHRKLFAVDMFLSALIAAIDLAFPYVTRKAMNTHLTVRFDSFTQEPAARVFRYAIFIVTEKHPGDCSRTIMKVLRTLRGAARTPRHS